MTMPAEGLTAREVAERLRQGLSNRVSRSNVRDHLAIVRRNLLTGFNAMVAPAAIVLFWLGDWRAAVAVSGMAIVNTGLSLVQEIRGKIHLDKLTLISEGKVLVRRDGAEIEIRSGDVVRDDCVVLRAGDAVVADGPVVESRYLEIDEALLTGESDPVRRAVGERLLSGSVCVAGEGVYRAAQVGVESFAQKTAAEARRHHASSSPLTRSINKIVRLLSYTAILLCLCHVTASMLFGLSADATARRVAATITTMVPQGLVLSSTITFIVAALAMTRRGAIVQRLNAIETMAAIDVVCTDKTGTLTTNRLRLESIFDLADPSRSNRIDDPGEPRDTVRVFASASIDRDNRNIRAIRQRLGVVNVEVVDQLPFKSRLRYSAVRLAGGDGRLIVLGAAEALAERCLPPLSAETLAWVGERQSDGVRMILLAEGDPHARLGAASELPATPLRPLAFLGFADELRPDAGQVLESLVRQGITFKVISGDNAETVQATVRHLNLPISAEPVVSGDELRSSADPASVIRAHGIFGRVSPDQKVDIVESLKADGRQVAMIGDGVNDVLPIKHAHLGIAMGSGTAASKRVAGLVLEGDRFELLPEALEEGRTILRNVRRGAKLFLVKNVYSLILIVAAYLGLGIPFPYVPQQVTLLNWSVIGIPGLAIAFSRQRADRVSQRPFLSDVLHFAIRTGAVFGLFGVALLVHADRLYPEEERRVRTMFLALLILLGVNTLFRALADGESGAQPRDRPFRILGMMAIPLFFAVLSAPPLRSFFELQWLSIGDWLLVLGYYAVCWMATVGVDWMTAAGMGWPTLRR